MKCELAQESIALAAYDELTDEQAHELGQHVETCQRCQQELQAMQELVHALSLVPAAEPSPNLLASSRLRLEEALDNLPPAGIFHRAQSAFRGTMTQLRMMPSMAAVLVLAGSALGAGAMHTFSTQGAAPGVSPVAAPLEPAASSAPFSVLSSAPSSVPADIATSPSIANISNVESQPGSNNVSVEYNQLVPAHLEGSIEDPQIRRLLVAAAQSGEDSTVQDNSVRLLADECRAGHACSEGPTRTALLYALRKDKEPSVRAQALLGLEPYVVNDERVRDAVLEAIMHDPSPLVRADAIRMLQPVQGDSTVRLVLHRMAAQEKNKLCRTASRQILSGTPEVQ